MKAAMYFIITAGIIFISLIIVLAFSPPAAASGDDHCRGNCGDVITNHYSYTSKNIRVEDVAKGVAATIIVMCTIRGIYVGITDKRVTWCGEGKPKPDPLPEPGPVVKTNDITPDSIQNRKYIIEAR